MLPRCLLRLTVGVSIATHVLGCAPRAIAGSPEEIEQKLQALQEQVNALRRQLDAAKAASPSVRVEQPAVPASPVPAIIQPTTEGTLVSEPAYRATYRSLLDGVKLGGYGSVRFESNSLDRASDSFTFRRFVLTADAQIAPPLRFGLELELERFTALELERSTSPRAGGGLATTEAIEGTSDTEISLEQAWLEWAFTPWLRYRAGMVLVPLGRFNWRFRRRSASSSRSRTPTRS